MRPIWISGNLPPRAAAARIRRRIRVLQVFRRVADEQDSRRAKLVAGRRRVKVREIESHA